MRLKYIYYLTKMKLNAEQMQIKILNKIRNQHIAETNKKQRNSHQNLFSPIKSNDKTPLKCQRNATMLSFNSSNFKSPQAKIGILKSFQLRQDYYQCFLQLNPSKLASSSAKMTCLVDRQQNCHLWVGHSYVIQQSQAMEFGGVNLIFAQLFQIQQGT